MFKNLKIAKIIAVAGVVGIALVAPSALATGNPSTTVTSTPVATTIAVDPTPVATTPAVDPASATTSTVTPATTPTVTPIPSVDLSSSSQVGVDEQGDNADEQGQVGVDEQSDNANNNSDEDQMNTSGDQVASGDQSVSVALGLQTNNDQQENN